MALPSNTTISISQIRTELGSASGSLRTLSSLAGKSVPDAMSEFWGYSAGPPLIYWDGQFIVSYSGPASGYVFAANFQPSISYIVPNTNGTWNINSDPTDGWDRYVLASGPPQNNFSFVHTYDNYSIGSETVSVYLTPPSGKSFANIVTYDSFIAYTSYDLALNYISFSYYGNDPGYTVGSSDLYFDLI